MKNLAFSLALILILAACSSGSTVADTPFNVTGLFSGEFENTSGSRQEGIILNIAEDQNNNIVGNIIFETDPNDPSSCAINSPISGSTSGFSVMLEAEVEDGISVTDADGNTTTSSGGSILYQLTQSNSGRTLSGTYVTTGIEECSNASGSGTLVVNR